MGYGSDGRERVCACMCVCVCVCVFVYTSAWARFLGHCSHATHPNTPMSSYIQGPLYITALFPLVHELQGLEGSNSVWYAFFGRRELEEEKLGQVAENSEQWDEIHARIELIDQEIDQKK